MAQDNEYLQKLIAARDREVAHRPRRRENFGGETKSRRLGKHP